MGKNSKVILVKRNGLVNCDSSNNLKYKTDIHHLSLTRRAFIQNYEYNKLIIDTVQVRIVLDVLFLYVSSIEFSTVLR